jgi:hypothetical protein
MVSLTYYQIFSVQYCQIRGILSKYPFGIGNVQADRPSNIMMSD